MQLLIAFLIYLVIFAIVASGMYYVCTRFFPGVPQALWICGVVLLIIILVAVAGMLAPGSGIVLPGFPR